MSNIKVRYEPDPDDDVGRIWLTLKTDQFAGHGFFWSDRDGLGDLAKGLAAYPLAGPVGDAWGYENVEGDNVVLRIRVTPVSRKGDLVADAVVADLYNLHQRVSVSFPTTYAEVDQFRQQLCALVEGQTDEAELSGS